MFFSLSIYGNLRPARIVKKPDSDRFEATMRTGWAQEGPAFFQHPEGHRRRL